MSSTSATQPFAEKLRDSASLPLPTPAHDPSGQPVACSTMTHGLFSCEPIARIFGHEGAAKQLLRNDFVLKQQDTMDIDELLQHDTSAEGIFVSKIPLGSAARPVPDGLNESDRRSFHAATHDSASHSLPLPSPVVPSPAWPLPAFHRSPTVDYPSREVCTP